MHTAPLRRFRTLRAVFALMLREMASTYGRSPGGFAWMVIDPVAAVALLTLVFSAFLYSPPLGRDFALFYATGLLPFTYYTELTAKIGQSIRAVRPLLAYPAVNFVDAVASRFLLNTLTSLVVFLLVTGGIVALSGERLDPDPLRVLNGFGILAALALGFGTLNCFLFGAFPLWERLWNILNRPLFLVSGVFFVVDDTPPPMRGLLEMNPLTHAIAEIRAGLYSTYDAPFVSSAYGYGTGLVALFFGVLLLARHHRYLATEGA
jgi:capsular polysaccharide transport system permease protein